MRVTTTVGSFKAMTPTAAGAAATCYMLHVLLLFQCLDDSRVLLQLTSLLYESPPHAYTALLSLGK